MNSGRIHQQLHLQDWALCELTWKWLRCQWYSKAWDHFEKDKPFHAPFFVMCKFPESEIRATFFADMSARCGESLAKCLADLRPSISRKSGLKITWKILHTFHEARSKVLSFSGSDLLTCMLPTFCPPTIWPMSLELCRKPYILEADDFLAACYRKAMTPKTLWTLHFSPTFVDSGTTGNPCVPNLRMKNAICDLRVEARSPGALENPNLLK